MTRVLILFLVLIYSYGWGQQAIVEELHIEGNQRLKELFIRDFVVMKKGEPLDSLFLNRDRTRLIRLPAVAHMEYRLTPLGSGNYALTYAIEENFTLIPSLNFYPTTNDALAYRIGLSEFNLFGRAMGLGAFYQRDVYDSYGLSFQAPFLFSRITGMGFQLQNVTTLEPVFFDDKVANYRYSNRSLSLTLMRQLHFNHALQLGASAFKEEYDYVSGATSPEVPTALEVNKFLVKSMYTYDDLNYEYYYVEGYKSLLNLQYVASSEASLPNFYLASNDFLYFNRVHQRFNWANRLRVGISTNNQSPFAPFAVDNNLNLRGVGNRVDRGTAMLVFNTEMRYTAFEKDWFALQANAFIDAGTWRSPGGDFMDFTRSENLRLYPGVGLRFIHKRIFNTVFRIDYGYGITKNASQGVVFGIGQYF